MISSIVFSYNITLLYVLSTGYVFKDWWYFIAYILAVIGLSPIGIFAWKIGSLLRELG